MNYKLHFTEYKNSSKLDITVSFVVVAGLPHTQGTQKNSENF